jgi:adenylate kinase family enzyme
LTRIVESARGRHQPALATHRKVEILGIAGAGKSTLASVLARDLWFEVAGFIHARRPAHLLQIVRSLPRLLPILARGLTRSPRISWPESKLLVYVSRWGRILGRQTPRAGTILLFDQGPLYAMVRLKAEGKPFTTGRAFAAWMDERLERWANELDAVVWLDAPDDVLWSRINDRPQGHKKKGEEADAGHRFIARYRRSFEDVLRAMEELGGPRILRFDTSIASAEQVAETLRPRLHVLEEVRRGR